MGGMGGMGAGGPDIFSMFGGMNDQAGPSDFGGFGGFAGAPAGPRAAAPPQATQADLRLSLEELYRGTTKKMKITKNVVDAASGKAVPVSRALGAAGGMIRAVWRLDLGAFQYRCCCYGLHAADRMGRLLRAAHCHRLIGLQGSCA